MGVVDCLGNFIFEIMRIKFIFAGILLISLNDIVFIRLINIKNEALMKFACSFLFTLVFFSLQAQINLENGLVAYYSFSGDYTDQSNFQNNASVAFETSFVEGFDFEANGGVSFDGINDYIEVPHADQINFQSQTSFTVSLWLKTPLTQADTEGTTNDIVSKWNNTGGQAHPYAVRIYNQTSQDNNGKILALVRRTTGAACSETSESVLLSTTAVNDDNWHHIVFTRSDDNKLQLYIDCQLESEIDDFSNCNLLNESRLLFGMRVPNGPFTRAYRGSMDELRLYNRSLSQDELNILCGLVSTDDLANETAEFNTFLLPNLVKYGQTFHIQTETPVKNVKAYAMNGAYFGQFSSDNTPILPVGMYLIVIELTDGIQIVRKLVVME